MYNFGDSSRLRDQQKEKTLITTDENEEFNKKNEDPPLISEQSSVDLTGYTPYPVPKVFISRNENGAVRFESLVVDNIKIPTPKYDEK
jgi:hypothetical protein